MADNDFAIVIGIDKYVEPGNDLKNAVRGALRFNDWLVKAAKVPADNIILLLSPNAFSPPVKGLDYKDATYDNIRKCINELKMRSNLEGGRFFFYYSGHGFTKRSMISTEDAIIQTDFVAEENSQPFSVDSLKSFFQDSTSFETQIFILDSCRDKKPDLFDLQHFKPLAGGDASKPMPDIKQFVFYATSLYSEANDFKGAFTDVLLDGLSGRADCMDFDCQVKRYFVYLDRLAKYITSFFRSHKEWAQIPKIVGELDESGMAMATLMPDSDIKRVKLILAVTPPDAKVTSVTILDAGGCETFPAVTDLSALPQVYPRQYTVQVEASGYAPQTLSVKAFSDPTTVPVKLERSGAVARAPAPASAPPTGGGMGGMTGGGGGGGAMAMAVPLPIDPTRVRALTRAAASYKANPAAFPAAKLPDLKIHVTEELAEVKVTSLDGKLFKPSEETHGLKEATNSYNDLPPGVYNVQVGLPGAAAHEQLVSLLPDEKGVVNASPPDAVGSRFSDELVNFSGLSAHLNDDCEYCAAARKAAASRSTATLLTIISDAATRGGHEPDHSRWLQRLGLGAGVALPNDARCGLQVLFATELGNRPTARAFAHNASLRFWRLDSPLVPAERLTESSQICGLGAYSRAAEPGVYWLAVSLPDSKEVVFSVALLDGYLTKVMLQQDDDGTFNVYQSVVSQKVDGPPTPPSLRRLEEVERLLLGGNRSKALRYANPLITSEKLDPMSGWIGAKLLFVRHRLEALKTLSERLIQLYPTASDTHVIRGVYLFAMQHERGAAKEHFDEAFKIGPPALRFWLTRLDAAAGSAGANGPYRDLIARMEQRTAPHPIWTAWIPKVFDVGKRIELS